MVLTSCFVSVAALGDIAPTVYSGSGVVPIHAPGIRMVSAKVDIEWGVPCNLATVFIMENTTSKAVEVQLGFPLHLPEKFTSKDKLGFAMAFDDVPVKPSEITVVGQDKNSYPRDMNWYRCKHTFPQGQTKVTVTTKLPASLIYHTPYRETLRYCIETGAAWDGTIGSEVVTIHFPVPVTQDLIVTATPAGYTVAGDKVRWEFKDFKPIGNDHDVNLEYLRPDVVNVLAHIREEHARDPASPKWIIQLAKHLFVLGRSDGADCASPSNLTKTDYEALLAKIKDQGDRAFIASIYSQKDSSWAKGGYEKKETAENAKDEFRAICILNQVDYQAYFRKSPYVNEARSLLEGLVKAQPKNALAWNVYLANFYRFGFAGVEPSDLFGKDLYFPAQSNLIKAAYANCPDDKCIQIWHKRCIAGQVISFEAWNERGSRSPVPQQKDDLKKQLKQQGIFEINYHQTEYGYW